MVSVTLAKQVGKGRKEKKEEQEQKLIDAPNIVPAPAPEPTAEPTPTAQPEFFATEAQVKAAFGDRPVSRSERIQLDFALLRGGGDIKGFGPDRGFTGEQAEIVKQAAEAERLRPEQQAQLEAAGAFEEVTPQRTELSTSTVAQGVPIASPVAAAISNLLNPEGFEGPVTEETVREQALRKIRDDELKKGTSEQVKFGVLIESIPLVGKAVSTYAGGLIQTPSANADAIIGEIESLGQEATNNQEKTRSGIMPASFAMSRARQMEEQLAELEGRLKYLVNISPILQAETDNVNKIEQKIFETKERTDNFRTAAAFALTAELTGTGRPIPTDEQMFFVE